MNRPPDTTQGFGPEPLMDHDLAIALGLSVALHVAVLSPLRVSLAVQQGTPGHRPGIEVELLDETGETSAPAVDAEVSADGSMEVVPPGRLISASAAPEPEPRAAREAPAPVEIKRTAAARRSVSARHGGSTSPSGSSAGGISVGDGFAAIDADLATIAGDVTVPPRPSTRNARPTYPLLARKGGFEGTVVLRFAVPPEPSANVEAIQLVETSGYDILDQAAQDAVRTWRFDPARQDGRPIPYTLMQRFRFALTPENARTKGTSSEDTASSAR